MKENTFIILDDHGTYIECEMLFTFEDPETLKNYIVYTDNTEDEEDNTNVFASIYEPKEENPTLYPIETDKEWDLIEMLLDKLQKE